MAIKISQMNSVVTPSMTDIKEISQERVTYKESNQQLFNLFAPGVTTEITTSTTLSVPIPRTIFLNPIDAGQILTFPALTEANGGRVGDLILIVNKGNFLAALRYSNNSSVPGTVINAGNVRLYVIKSLGTPGALEVVDVLGTGRNQDVPYGINVGGTGGVTAAQARQNLGVKANSGYNAITVSSHTVAEADQYQNNFFTNNSANTLIVPINDSIPLPVGFTANYLQASPSGNVTITSQSGTVELVSPALFSSTNHEGHYVELTKVDLDKWYVNFPYFL